jgi:hypothetical protein
MQDFAFYNVGCHDAKGPRGLLVLVRRTVRRILRPMFLRQADIFRHLADLLDDHEHRVFALRIDADESKRQHAKLNRQHEEMAGRQDELSARQDELADQLRTTMALGWDYVAMVRRLATIEDQLASLTGSNGTPADEGDGQPSILFPGLEKAMRKPSNDDDDDQIRSKVC